MEALPFGIITSNIIDTEASNIEVLRDQKGVHNSVWCDRVVKGRNFAEVKGWAHLNRKFCDRV